MYQKRKTVDIEIKDLIRVMHNSLQFIEETSDLTKILSESKYTIEKLLEVIHESSQFIRTYLDVTTVGEPKPILLRDGLNIDFRRKMEIGRKFAKNRRLQETIGKP